MFIGDLLYQLIVFGIPVIVLALIIVFLAMIRNKKYQLQRIEEKIDELQKQK